MFLHLGRDIAVSYQAIIGIFDLDNSTHSVHTRRLLARAEREGRVVTVSDELPKSAVVCREDGRAVVYISQISPQTLLRRVQSGGLPDNLL